MARETKKRGGAKRAESSPLPKIPSPIAIEGTLAALSASPDADKLARAQDLIYDAWEAETPKRRVALALNALEISPLCADAHVLLAEHAELDSAEELAGWRLAVSAGEAAVGASAFEDDVGHFWGLLETRPYMRARLGLAMALWRRAQPDEAIAHLRQMLRLNPNDNQGARYLLALWLLETDRDDELANLLTTYAEDGATAWTWTAALAAFRRTGDSPKSRGLLAEALGGNKHVAAYLLGSRKLPKAMPAYITFGGEDEAVSYVEDGLRGWRMTPGALDWLLGQAGTASPVKATRPSRSRRR